MLMQLSRKSKVLKRFCDIRIEQNRNVIILIDGDTGTGKTLGALRLALEFDSKFSKEFITQDADNILKLFAKIGADRERYRGRVVIYEETQEDMLKSSTTTIEAKAIIKLFSKFRFTNGILIMTTPRSGHLNKYLMDYVDVHIHTEKIFYRRKVCRVKVKFGRWVESKARMFWEFMRVQYKDGEIFQLKYIDLLIPPQRIIDYYEVLKDDFFIDSMKREGGRIDRKYNKKVLPAFPQHCNKCGYDWKSRTPKPMRCPRCQLAMPFEKKPTPPTMAKN